MQKYKWPLMGLVLIVAQTFGPYSSLVHANTSCSAFKESASRLRSWSELPVLHSTSLPPDFVAALKQNADVRSIQKQFGRGESLSFRIPKALRTEGNGWGIQGQFLIDIITTLFPDAELTDGFARSNGVMFSVHDSTIAGALAPDIVDMTDLKIANPGPALPARSTLRTQMNLSQTARIASIYFSWTHKAEVVPTVLNMAHEGAFDLAIISAQDGADINDSVMMKFAATGIPVYYADDWSASSDRPRRAIILNTTRGRMPQIHAAADYAVVFGMANCLEPIRAGRPTYFTRSVVNKFSGEAWRRMVTAATASGLGRPFDTFQELMTQIKEDRVHPPVAKESPLREQIEHLLRPLLFAVERMKL